MPVSKEPGLSLTISVDPVPCSLGLPSQSLELPHGPSDQVLVDARCNGVQLGAVERSVVVDPAPHLRIDLLGEIGQVRSAATDEAPLPDLFALRLLRLGAHSR